MARTFRQSQATLHTWSGLLLGWVLFIVFLTGTAAYWRETLNRWMHPETPRVERPAEVLDHVQRFLDRKAPNAQSWFITLATPQSPGAYAFWAPKPDPDAPDGGRRRRSDTTVLIGADGAPVARETRGGDFFYRFHFDLHYMPVLWARWLVGIASMMMLVAILTGIVTHKKIFRDFFTLRRAKGQRSWLDGHNATAVLALPFHLMITYTGLVTLATLLMPAAVITDYGAQNRIFEAIFPRPPVVEPLGRATPMVPLAPIIRDAEHRFGGPAGYLEVAHPGDAAARITVTRASSATLSSHGASVSYDGTTGRMLWQSPPRGAAMTTYGAMIGIHAGRFGDTLLRWLYFLAGVAGTLMVATGLVLWTVKRREKLAAPDRPPFSFRVVERLNMVVVGGFPLACVAYLLANRLLPLGGAGRADREIAAMFIVWGVAALLAMILRPRVSWTLLLAATALALVSLPVLDLLALHPGLLAWLADGDWAMVGVEAVLLVLAIGFGWSARRVWRHSPPTRARRAARAAAPVRQTVPAE